jgi:hypothetical protein
MSVLQTSQSIEKYPAVAPIKQPWGRLFILCALLVCAIGPNVGLLATAPALNASSSITPFLLIWLVAFVPYLGACLFVLMTRVHQGRQQWIELGIILVGALILRLLLLPAFPFLSHDALRYLWDARVTLHGYSPYTTIPQSSVLIPLRDTLLYPNMGYQDVPTLYPPGAQAIYVVSYLLGGSNVFLLKTIFMLFDLLTCVALAFLLHRRGLDPRRSIIYAWSPLVIVEFALQGHVDVLTITFSVLAILCALSTWRGSRAVTGFLIGMATVTKLYPILLLVLVIRRRDYALLASCAITILAFYTPYLILGHGNAFGFLSAYADQHPTNQGIVPLALLWIGSIFHISLRTSFQLEHILDVLIAGSVSLLVLYLRQRERISMEAGYLILIGMIFSISSHVFSWYTTAMLPWVALLIGQLWQRHYGIHSTSLAAIMVWYFASLSLISYFFNGSGDWRIYYALIYYITLAGLVVSAVKAAIRHLRKSLVA